MTVLEQITKEQIRTDLPKLLIGDTVRVHLKVVEGNKARVQVFEGIIIGFKNGGIGRTMTVRKVVGGIGVEKVLLVNSPNIVKIEVVRHGVARRKKLYYLRDRVGKKTRLREKIFKKQEGAALEVVEEALGSAQEVVETSDDDNVVDAPAEVTEAAEDAL